MYFMLLVEASEAEYLEGCCLLRPFAETEPNEKRAFRMNDLFTFLLYNFSPGKFEVLKVNSRL